MSLVLLVQRLWDPIFYNMHIGLLYTACDEHPCTNTFANIWKYKFLSGDIDMKLRCFHKDLD